MKIARIVSLIGLAAIASLPAGAKEWQAVRFGIDATYPPFESVNPQGEMVGFELDYAKALCAKMHVTCSFQNQDWDGIIPALLSGKFDVIFSSMNETPERAKKVLFSEVYYATPPVFVTQGGTKGDDISPAALKGMAVGTQSSTVFANYLDASYKASEIKLYPGGDEPFVDLANGRLDYVVSDILVAEKFIEKNPGCCRIVSKIARTPDIFGPGVGAAFRPGDTELKDMFNKAIDEADADGTYQKLAGQYFKIDIRAK